MCGTESPLPLLVDITRGCNYSDMPLKYLLPLLYKQKTETVMEINSLFFIVTSCDHFWG